MRVRNVISGTIAASLAAAFTAASPQPANAFHFTIINGVCFNPAGNIIPLKAALKNPHCAFTPENPPNPEYPKGKGKIKTESSGMKTGKIVVGCLMGSALGLITASVVKGGGLKWMTQKEWEDLKVKVPNPLTNNEAATIAFTCGLATGPVIANFRKPQPVTVKAKF
jgi:hypothetical protein